MRIKIKRNILPVLILLGVGIGNCNLLAHENEEITASVCESNVCKVSSFDFESSVKIDKFEVKLEKVKEINGSKQYVLSYEVMGKIPVCGDHSFSINEADVEEVDSQTAAANGVRVLEVVLKPKAKEGSFDEETMFTEFSVKKNITLNSRPSDWRTENVRFICADNHQVIELK